MVNGVDGRFMFAEQGEITAPLSQYAERYGSAVEEGHLIEACLGAAEWMDRIGALLVSGDVLIIDYGYDTRELPRYPEGTLVGFKRHAVASDFLSEPGRRDITAQVNFSYLRDLAIGAGLKVVGESSLAQWAMDIWNEDELTKRLKESDNRWRMLWKHLVFGMGSGFRVLHLRKENVEGEVATK
jgi:SAM-dependent MidA family methyltransferase